MFKSSSTKEEFQNISIPDRSKLKSPRRHRISSRSSKNQNYNQSDDSDSDLDENDSSNSKKRDSSFRKKSYIKHSDSGDKAKTIAIRSSQMQKQAKNSHNEISHIPKHKRKTTSVRMIDPNPNPTDEDSVDFDVKSNEQLAVHFEEPENIQKQKIKRKRRHKRSESTRIPQRTKTISNTLSKIPVRKNNIMNDEVESPIKTSNKSPSIKKTRHKKRKTAKNSESESSRASKRSSSQNESSEKRANISLSKSSSIENTHIPEKRSTIPQIRSSPKLKSKTFHLRNNEDMNSDENDEAEILTKTEKYQFELKNISQQNSFDNQTLQEQDAFIINAYKDQSDQSLNEKPDGNISYKEQTNMNLKFSGKQQINYNPYGQDSDQNSSNQNASEQDSNPQFSTNSSTEQFYPNSIKTSNQPNSNENYLIKNSNQQNQSNIVRTSNESNSITNSNDNNIIKNSNQSNVIRNSNEILNSKLSQIPKFDNGNKAIPQKPPSVLESTSSTTRQIIIPHQKPKVNLATPLSPIQSPSFNHHYQQQNKYLPPIDNNPIVPKIQPPNNGQKLEPSSPRSFNKQPLTKIACPPSSKNNENRLASPRKISTSNTKDVNQMDSNNRIQQLDPEIAQQLLQPQIPSTTQHYQRMKMTSVQAHTKPQSRHKKHRSRSSNQNEESNQTNSNELNQNVNTIEQPNQTNSNEQIKQTIHNDDKQTNQSNSKSETINKDGSSQLNKESTNEINQLNNENDGLGQKANLHKEKSQTIVFTADTQLTPSQQQKIFSSSLPIPISETKEHKHHHHRSRSDKLSTSTNSLTGSSEHKHRHRHRRRKTKEELDGKSHSQRVSIPESSEKPPEINNSKSAPLIKLEEETPTKDNTPFVFTPPPKEKVNNESLTPKSNNEPFLFTPPPQEKLYHPDLKNQSPSEKVDGDHSPPKLVISTFESPTIGKTEKPKKQITLKPEITLTFSSSHFSPSNSLNNHELSRTHSYELLLDDQQEINNQTSLYSNPQLSNSAPQLAQSVDDETDSNGNLVDKQLENEIANEVLSPTRNLLSKSSRNISNNNLLDNQSNLLSKSHNISNNNLMDNEQLSDDDGQIDYEKGENVGQFDFEKSENALSNSQPIQESLPTVSEIPTSNTVKIQSSDQRESPRMSVKFILPPNFKFQPKSRTFRVQSDPDEVLVPTNIPDNDSLAQTFQEPTDFTKACKLPLSYLTSTIDQDYQNDIKSDDVDNYSKSEEEEEDFNDPPDFSKAYRFPLKYLTTQIGNEEEEDFMNSDEPLSTSITDALHEDEQQLIEADEKIGSNFTIVKLHLKNKDIFEDVREILEDNLSEHFVLAISPFSMVVESIYILNKETFTMRKVWGNHGPLIVGEADVGAFYKISRETKKMLPLTNIMKLSVNVDAVAF